MSKFLIKPGMSLKTALDKEDRNGEKMMQRLAKPSMMRYLPRKERAIKRFKARTYRTLAPLSTLE